MFTDLISFSPGAYWHVPNVRLETLAVPLRLGVAVTTFRGVIFVFVLSAKQVKTEEQIAAEQAWYGSEKVWLVHKDGFSLGKSRPLGLVTFCYLI